MKIRHLAMLFFTVTVGCSLLAMSAEEQDIDLDKLKTLSQDIPCLRPVIALLPELLVIYRELMRQNALEGGAYVMDHAHRQIYMPQHVIEHIPFLSAKQSFESKQQGTVGKAPVTIKLDHPDIEATFLSWLFEIIEQDLHKADKKTLMRSLMERKLPTKKETVALRAKLGMPELADGIDEARSEKIAAQKKAQRESKTYISSGIWELKGAIKIPLHDLKASFKITPYKDYQTKDLHLNGLDMFFMIRRHENNIGIYLQPRSVDVFLEWTGNFAGHSKSAPMEQYTLEKYNLGYTDFMKVTDLDSVKRPSLIFEFTIKMIVD